MPSQLIVPLALIALSATLVLALASAMVLLGKPTPPALPRRRNRQDARSEAGSDGRR